MSDDDLHREVERLREEVDTLRRRLDALESPSSDDEPARTTESSAASVDREETAETGEDESLESEDRDSVTPHDEGRSADTASDDGTGSAAATGDEPDGTVSDWELAIGVRWLGLAGALALVVGVVFFARLAIETGLLGPLGRVVAGTAGGLVLFGGGRFAASRRGYDRWGRIVAGAGLAVAYFSLYAAYGFESYRQAIGTPLWLVLGGLTLLVAVTAALSVRDGTPLVVGEAFLFGYVTATLSTEAATFVLTPVYAVLLAGGLVAIATVQPWSRLVVSSTIATYAVLWLWIADLEPPSVAIGLVAVAALLIYLVGGYVLRGSDRVGERWYRFQLIALTAVNAVFAAFLLEIAVRGVGSDAAVDGLGTGAVALALAGAYAITDRRSVRRDDAAGAGSVVFLAAGIGMAVGPFATTVATLAVVCAAVALSRVTGSPAFRIGAHGVAAALVLKLLAVDATELSAFDAADPTATVTGRPVAFGLSIAAFYALAWWFAVDETSLTDAERGGSDRPPIDAAYAAAGTALTVFVLALELSGVEISVAWALFGFALLGIGLATAVRRVRVLGIAVLGLTTAKVFLFDTNDLDTVARTLSFLVLGAVLLTASYVYARTQRETAFGLGLVDRDEE